MPDETVTVVYLLDPPATARALGVTVDTLKAWRRKGVGPPFVRFGNRIRYRATDLDTWLDSQTITPGAPVAHQP